MNTFLLDLWHDLRAKRLWPVAALLVVALAAIPLALKKHSSNPQPPAAATPAPAQSASAEKAVVVAATDSSKNSTLGVFNKKDPFKPDKAVLAAAHPKPTPSQSQPASGSQSGGQSSQPSSGSQGGGSPAGSGGAPAVQPQPQSQPAPQKPAKPQGPFVYTVDVKFGKFGEPRVHHNVQKLDVLPNQNNPLLVFLGVNSTGDTAVFLTDTSLKAAGEGSCKPDGDTCSFLYLKLDKNHNSEDLSELAADGTGTEYSLTLLAIHKVPVSELAKGAKKAAAAARAEARRARVLKHKTPTPFVVPLGLQLQPDTVG